MTLKHPEWWDSNSNQPYKLQSIEKHRFGLNNLREYSLTALTALLLSPFIAWRYAKIKPKPITQTKDFMGLGVSFDFGDIEEIVDLVEELDVKHLLIRVPSWHIKHLDTYINFAERFPQRKLLINILQCRDTVENLRTWSEAVNLIVESFLPLTKEFQLGNAINRSKWGCLNLGDYLNLLDSTRKIQDRFPQATFTGSSVIDFEPVATLRTLINSHQYQLDACTSALYVNRRGSPYSRQFGVFDLNRKIRLIASLISLSNRCQNRFWITEINWPLLNTTPYTPNSGHPRSTVDEKTQAKFLTDYYQIAHATGFVERVYWWQLINPGYGLVDHRGANIRRMPSFYAFRKLLSEGIEPQLSQFS
tara:strand:+ start:1151 stop:2236 length:1086 start_codon:yes stop_codon:yes gene_type:complete